MPKIYDKEIVRLDPDEVALLLDEVENPENLTKSQKNSILKPRLGIWR